MTDNGQIAWQDPPQRNTGIGREGRWVKILTPLLEQPGRWARIAVYDRQQAAASGAGNLNKQAVKRPPGRWQFVSRAIGDSTWGVYARYLGPEDKAP